MTTIVYDHKARQIAVDGRATSGHLINTEEAIKWAQDGDDWWFICGAVCDENQFIEYMNAKDPDTPKREIECSAFLVSAGRVYQCVIDEGKQCKSEINYSDSIGSGSQWALAALDMGKTAAESVEYAKTRDTGTGGKVSVFDIERMGFIQ